MTVVIKACYSIGNGKKFQDLNILYVFFAHVSGSLPLSRLKMEPVENFKR